MAPTAAAAAAGGNDIVSFWLSFSWWWFLFSVGSWISSLRSLPPGNDPMDTVDVNTLMIKSKRERAAAKAKRFLSL